MLPPSPADESLSDPVAEQFRFIELHLAFEGGVTNRQIREHFGVSQVQASRIIRRFRDTRPGQMEPLAGRGSYQRGPRFRWNEGAGAIGSYLATWQGGDKNAMVYRPNLDFTRVDPKIARPIVQSVLRGCGVDVLYRSMTHPDGQRRRLFPHAFAFAGRRWHMRALAEDVGEFRDFNIARVAEADLTDTVRPVAAQDVEWMTWVDMHIHAHPDLSWEQSKVIRDEFFAGTSGRIVRTRQAMQNYVLRELEVASDPASQKPPEYQLALYSVSPVSEQG